MTLLFVILSSSLSSLYLSLSLSYFCAMFLSRRVHGGSGEMLRLETFALCLSPRPGLGGCFFCCSWVSGSCVAYPATKKWHTWKHFVVCKALIISVLWFCASHHLLPHDCLWCQLGRATGVTGIILQLLSLLPEYFRVLVLRVCSRSLWVLWPGFYWPFFL